MNSGTLILKAPLAGWCMPLAEVPDPVFAERMAGDGVAIDPTGGVLHAPCDGEIVPMKGAKHAVTLRAESGIDILVHVGIDTVALAGEGFELLVSPGQRVRSGEALLRFDLDFVVRRAKSAVSPIVLASGGSIAKRAENRALAVGDWLMEVAAPGATAEASNAEGIDARRHFRVPFDHGLHVRPAALIAAALRPFKAEVVIMWHGRSANARSTVAMMSLGVHCGDTVEVRALGPDAAAAVAALEPLLAPATPAPSRPEITTRARAHVSASRRIEGVIASRGLAVGQAVQWSQAEVAVAEAGRGEAAEADALQVALASVKQHLDALAGAAPGEQRTLLAAHAELVQDPELEREAKEWMRRGKSAAYAWRQATRSIADALGAIDDERMRERAADLRDIENQVLRVLGGEAPVAAREIPAASILLADDLLPSQLMALDPSRVAGICMARGGPTSHVAIIAAASGIPALVAAGPGILEVPDAMPVILDAEHGWLDIDPPAAERERAERAAVQRAEERATDFVAASRPCETLDGLRITVNANVGSLEEARAAVANGAEGCGLLRTEFLFLDRRDPPDEVEQAAEYQRIAAALEGRPLNVRTLDAAGDKPIAYLPMPREENPALGLRGVRASFLRPDLLRTQLRAVMQVEPRGQCRILLPMVNDLEELRAVRSLARECATELGLAAAPAIGIMIETPSAALLAGQLAKEADFLSIGTNDLSQYALAIDRGHPELARRLDALHPAVLRLIAVAADAAQGEGKEIAVCGALGSDVDAIPILIGLGIHEVSATTAMIPRIKRLVRMLTASECRNLASRALELETAAAVRELAHDAGSRARALPSPQPLTGGSP